MTEELKIPTRLRVLHGLTRVIESVNPENGYDHDLREKVARGRVFFGPADKLPFVSILEAPIPEDVSKTSGDRSATAGEWQLVIQGFAEEDHNHPTDSAHYLMAEVKHAIITQNDPDFIYNKFRERGRQQRNVGAVEIYLGQGVVRPGDTPSENSFFWLSLTLLMVDDLKNPYA